MAENDEDTKMDRDQGTRASHLQQTTGDQFLYKIIDPGII